MDPVEDARTGLALRLQYRVAAEALMRYASQLRDKVVAIPNGSDPSPTVAIPDTEFFRVSFIGWLYDDFMDPQPVLAACARLRKRAGLDAPTPHLITRNPVSRSTPDPQVSSNDT